RGHAEHLERLAGNLKRSPAGGAHLGKIAHAAQEAIGDARRATAAPRDLLGTRFIHTESKNPCRPTYNFDQILVLVEIETVHDAEARAQRRGNQPGARRRADKRELTQPEGMNPCGGALADHQIYSIVLHRRIKDLFDRGQQAVNLIEEEDLARVERGEDGGQGYLAVEEGSGTHLDGDAELIGENLRERGLAQPRRAVEQDMVKRLAAAARRFDGNGNVLLHARMADEVGETFGPDAGLDARVFLECLA